MKLLLDQNISFRVVKLIQHKYEVVRQVRELGLENAKDRAIWNYAKEHQFSIVTFDADFYELSNYYGHPPKIIWLRSGNIKTPEISELLINKFNIIKEFIEFQNDVACIELD